MGRFQFLLRCMFRHRLRTTLTILSLITAFALFMLLRSVALVFEAGWEGAEETRMVTQSKYSMIEMLPLAHKQVIQNIEGVKHVSHASWFGGIFEEGETSVGTFAIDVDTYFDVYQEYVIDPEVMEKFRSTRTAAIAPVNMVENYGWEIGQQIPVISPIFPSPTGEPWVFELVGTYEAITSQDSWLAFLFHYDYFNETMKFDRVGWYNFTIEDPDAADEIKTAIDRQFENSSDQTRTLTESESFRQFLAQMGDISLMMTGILSAVFFTMILLTANGMVQSYRERIPELAVMKTLGFSNLSVATLIMAEALLLCGISAAIGIALGTGLVQVAQSVLSTMAPMVFQASTAYLAIAVALGLGFAVGLVPSINANRLVIVDALQAH